MASATDDSASPTGRASQACISCRKQKRRCDKQLPSCSLCARLNRICDYNDPSTSSTDDLLFLRRKVEELEARLSEKVIDQVDGLSPLSGVSPASNPFPAAFFLDAEIFEQFNLRVPRPIVMTPPEVLSELGHASDIQTIAELYLSSVHLWLPIVSRKRLSLLIHSPPTEPGGDLALLFLCMKLITQCPQEHLDMSQCSLYLITKSFLSQVESSALMSIQVVQSAMLICAYEVGHGIYPAAYLSAAHCARLCYALGLHDRKGTLQMLKRPGSWAEQEEIRRIWWGAMLLDRYVNLGSRARPLATDDPARSDVLPADDDLWDRGELAASEPLYISSPTTVRVGPYARTCQATHLLGRLIRHLNDRNVEPVFRFSEAIQLYRTMAAFTSLLPEEVGTSPERFSTALALTYGGILHLCDPYVCTETNHGDRTTEETEMQAIAFPGLRKTSEDILRLSNFLRISWECNIAAASPLVADCLYVAAATFAWLVYEDGSPELRVSYSTLFEALKLLDTRWKVAGEYLKILQLTQDSLYADPASVPAPSSQNGH